MRRLAGYSFPRYGDGKPRGRASANGQPAAELSHKSPQNPKALALRIVEVDGVVYGRPVHVGDDF